MLLTRIASAADGRLASYHFCHATSIPEEMLSQPGKPRLPADIDWPLIAAPPRLSRHLVLFDDARPLSSQNFNATSWSHFSMASFIVPSPPRFGLHAAISATTTVAHVFKACFLARRYAIDGRSYQLARYRPRLYSERRKAKSAHTGLLGPRAKHALIADAQLTHQLVDDASFDGQATAWHSHTQPRWPRKCLLSPVLAFWHLLNRRPGFDNAISR